mgnify:CR=1 FL=1|jgi:hypothetical protein
MNKSQIVAHRGYWTEGLKPNSIDALLEALNRGWSIEFDIRYHKDKIVIQHDLPSTHSEYEKLTTLLKMLPRLKDDQLLFINIKCDELHDELKNILHNLDNYVLFDLSIPHLIKCSINGLKCLNRQSEYELGASELDKITVGTWYDGFIKTEIPLDYSKDRINVLVSPELHNRSLPDVSSICEFASQNNFYICTDKPLKYESSNF